MSASPITPAPFVIEKHIQVTPRLCNKPFLSYTHECATGQACDSCLWDLASYLANEMSAGLTLPRQGDVLLARALARPADWYWEQVGGAEEGYTLDRAADLRRMAVAICHPGMRPDGLAPLPGFVHLKDTVVADFYDDEPLLNLRAEALTNPVESSQPIGFSGFVALTALMLAILAGVML